jgi:3-methyladenine DNA glycosylase AlkD
MTRRDLERDLAALADPQRAANLAWFFKTGKGEYAEGDRFLGIPVPQVRKTALRYHALPLEDLARLLSSRIHEHRFAALEILVRQYERAADGRREEIVDFYLRHTAGVNNWDLVDTSAPYILGEHLKTHPRKVLRRLAASPVVWERRIAMIATMTLIHAGEISDTLRIAAILLTDKHDLIHKAVGWMLREAGKVSRPALLKFLAKHYASVPRTTLRYAIEHLPAEQRKRILVGDFA